MNSSSCVVLHWPSFGPYHTARLAACADLAPPGVRVVGLAVAGRVEGRPWSPDRVMQGVEVVTLFPEAMYHELPAAGVKAAIARNLGELAPGVVGISGYGMVDSRAALQWCCANRVGRVLMTESKADDAVRLWWKEWLKRRLVARFGSALCGGSPHRSYLKELGMPGERVFDRYDVVDNDRFLKAATAARMESLRYRQLPGLADERPFFLASSRLIPRKNIDGLLEAYRRYRVLSPFGWRLVVLGTGPGEEALKQQVVEQGIPDVCFAGFHQFDELAAYYALAGAFVHPALQEQWGLVVNEAMACGLPVLVAGQVGAAADLVEDGVNGFVFDPRNPQDLAGVMEKVAHDAGLRERMAGTSLAKIANWTPEHFAMNFWKAAALAVEHAKGGHGNAHA